MSALSNYLKRRKLTQEELKKILHYDPDTGIFTWRINRKNTIREGSIAGSVKGNNYRIIEIEGVCYKASRLAWLYITGAWPKEQVDHENRIKSDNRWTNLREANNIQNQHNVGLRNSNTSGIRGVSWAKERNKWLATIRVNGKKKHIGLYNTIEEAKEAYDKAAREAFGKYYNDRAT